MSNGLSLLEIHLREYDKMKSEQAARIGFRDNLVYATLAAYGAILAFAVKDNHLALLILPWVSVVLGWAYLVNDEKVSSIGRYVRATLSGHIARLLPGTHVEDLFGWELAHRSDRRRRRRKIEQLVVDEVVFVVSGVAALIGFCIAVPHPHVGLLAIGLLEGLLLLVLGIEIIVYADLSMGN